MHSDFEGLPTDMHRLICHYLLPREIIPLAINRYFAKTRLHLGKWTQLLSEKMELDEDDTFESSCFRSMTHCQFLKYVAECLEDDTLRQRSRQYRFKYKSFTLCRHGGFTFYNKCFRKSRSEVVQYLSHYDFTKKTSSQPLVKTKVILFNLYLREARTACALVDL